MTADGLASTMPADAAASSDFAEDYLLLRWKPHTDAQAALGRFQKLAGPDEPFDAAGATLPTGVAVLGDLRVASLLPSRSLALRGIATVAHALVTTVRRRRADLAILRSIGFTDATHAVSDRVAGNAPCRRRPRRRRPPRNPRRASGMEAAREFVPARVRAATRDPLDIADRADRADIANTLAAGPTHAATRIHPASVLRTE